MLQRIFTIIITIPVVILCTYLGGESFLLLVVTITFFCLSEFYSLFEKMGTKPFVIEGQILSIFFIFLAFSSTLKQEAMPDFFLNLIKNFWLSIFTAIFTLILIFFFIWELFRKKIFFQKSAIFTTIRGSFYTGWLSSYLILIRNFTTPRFTFLLLATIWANDTFAYLIGTFIGRARDKLWEEISPKKTWTGAIGGLIGSISTAFIFRIFFPIPIIHILILSLVISITAQIGDLIESFYKRKAQVKDSGNILPGHGGILDRWDSFILTSPIVFYYLLFFGL